MRSSGDVGLRQSLLRSGVSGVVRDRTGRPQIGAVVELLNARSGVVAQTFTDDRGRYTLPRLSAGLYQVKASNALFLPTIRPDLKLLANSRVIVNLTLSTLYQALQWLPAEPRGAATANDDWNWTLRLSANRPLLRMLEPAEGRALEAQARLGADESTSGTEDDTVSTGTAGGGLVMLQNEQVSREAGQNRRLAVHTGLRRFGQGGVAEQMGWRSSGGETRAIALAARTSLDPSGHFASLATTAAYRQELSPDRSMLTIVSFADRNGIAGGGASGLVTMRARSASTVRLGDLAQLAVGTELAAARLGSESLTAGSHPFGSLQVEAGDTLVRYSVASAPSMADADRMEAVAGEDAPHLTQVGGRLQMEQGLHQELSLTRTTTRGSGRWTGQVALFHDRLAHPMIEGGLRGDEAALDSKDVLYDPLTGTIAVSGPGYSGGGVLAMLHEQLSADTWISLRYAIGEAVTMPGGEEYAQGLQPAEAPTAAPFGRESVRTSAMASLSAGTRIAATGATVRGSYRWQPVSTLTQVAPFAADIPDAYLGFSVRQPLHLERVGPGKIEAIVDVRNLLAQGYRPFVSQDGSTVYFAQSQRCIAGGIAFTF